MIYRIHIPKTAGIAMQHATAELNKRGADIRKPPGYIHGYLRQHPWLKEIPVMSVIRNPWDRLVSLCEHERRQGDHNYPFADFVKACADKIAARPDVLDEVVPDDSTRPRGHALVLTSCRHWLVHEPGGPVHCDHLLRFETLADDWLVFCNRVGVHARLQRRNFFGERPDYRTYYTDAIREIVDPIFKEDTDEFGYTFDPA